MPRVRKLLAGLMVAVCFLANPLNGPDVVLCLGSDGHAAVELAQNGRCEPGACTRAGLLSGIFEISTNPLQGGHCDPCVDVPLNQQAALTQCETATNQRVPQHLRAEQTKAFSGSTFIQMDFRTPGARASGQESLDIPLPNSPICVLRI